MVVSSIELGLIDKMNNLLDKQQKYLPGFLGIVLVVTGFHTNAGSRSNEVNYSPDHWPSRWSSAIHQQKTGKFPKREQDQTQPDELPDAVSEQDLFYSYLNRGRMDPDNNWKKYDRRYLQQPVRDSRRQTAYQSGQGNYNRLRSLPYNYGSNPYYGSNLMIDPVTGFPGGGFPVLPGMPGYAPIFSPYGGVPYGGFPYRGGPYGGSPFGFSPFGSMPFFGSPFGGTPYGYYGSPGIWGPNSRAW